MSFHGTGQGRKELRGDGPWLDVNEPQVIFAQSKRKAGKGVAIDECVHELWKAGITIMHAWAARNNENWYYALVKGCRAYWDDWRKEHREEIEQGKLEEPLHCDCHEPLPISVMLPENIYNSMKHWQIDVFNGINFKSREEYDQAYDAGLVPWLPNEPWIDVRQIKKPEKLIKKGKFFPLIKLKKFTVPSLGSVNAQNKFWHDFVEIFQEARLERRIIVMNPMMFTGYDKFHTAAFILNNIYKLTQKYCPPLDPADVGVETREQMTPVQKSWHKFAVVVGEIKTLAPSQKLNPESGVGETKKALYNMIGEARHWQCWLLGDYQSPDDIFSGVKFQSDLYIIKRATMNLLGDDWRSLWPLIESKRQRIFEKNGGMNPKSIYLADREWPEINHLPDNLGYIVMDGEITKLETFRGGSWHHKHTREQFTKDFGIDIPEEVLSNLKKELDEEGKSTSSTKGPKPSKKKITESVYRDMDYYILKEKLDYAACKTKLVEDYEDEDDKKNFVEKLKPDSLGQGYRRWKKKHGDV